MIYINRGCRRREGDRPDGWLRHDCVEDAHQDPDSQKGRHLIPGGQHGSAVPLIPEPRRRSGKEAMPKTEKRQGTQQGKAALRRQRHRHGYYDQELEDENLNPQARPGIEPVKTGRDGSEIFLSRIALSVPRSFSSSAPEKRERLRPCRRQPATRGFCGRGRGGAKWPGNRYSAAGDCRFGQISMRPPA